MSHIREAAFETVAFRSTSTWSYALTWQASEGCVIEPVPQEGVAAQEERFQALLDRLGPPAMDEELRAALAAREQASSPSREPR